MTLSVTGSVTYLAASSFSDNSWIEENTRRGSLKPHAKAESFRGLLNFSVSRQNRLLTGSSEDLPIQRRTVIPVHLFLRNHFSSFPSVHLPVVHEVTSGAREPFQRNQFSSCPGDRYEERCV